MTPFASAQSAGRAANPAYDPLPRIMMTPRLTLLAFLAIPLLAQSSLRNCGGGVKENCQIITDASGNVTLDGNVALGTTVLDPTTGLAGPNNAPSVVVPTLAPIAATITVPASILPLWLSSDRKTLYGGGGQVLYTSIDSGLNWTAVSGAMFGSTGVSSMAGVRELANGELLVGVGAGGGSSGFLMLSSGYPTLGINATWTKVLTASGTENYFSPTWGLSAYNNIVVATEYGSSISPTNARYVYLSTNSGQTWTQIFDIGAVSGTHTHYAAYDPWWDAIWLTNGDAVATRALRVSFDHGTTWTVVEQGVQQFTSVLPMQGCILFLTDGFTSGSGAVNGVYRIRRTADRSIGPLEVAYALDSATSITHAGTMAFQAQGVHMPALLPFVVDTASGHGLVLATYDGFSFSTLWTDTESYTVGGVRNLFGPTASGNYLGCVANNEGIGTLSFAAPPLPEMIGIEAEQASAIATALSATTMMKSGYYVAPSAGSTGAQTRSDSLMYLVPVYFPRAGALDRISVDVTIAGGTGSVTRLGIYNSDSQGGVGTLLLDAGTVDSTGTGLLEKTILQPVNRGVYWLAAVAQGNPTPAPTFEVNLGNIPGLGYSTGLNVATGVTGLYVNSVSGALPTGTPTLGGSSASSIRVLVRVK